MVATVALLVAAGVILGWSLTRDASRSNEAHQAKATQSKDSSNQKQEARVDEPAALPSPDAQPVVAHWVAGQSATYSIAVYDPAAKKTTGSNQPDTELFAASLYKLFVAYLALEDMQKGVQQPDQVLTGGFTRKQCVDKMIRESHSPCGEAMMADMTPAALESRLKAMDIHNTVFNGIRTTARDCAKILQYIIEKRHLNDANTAFLRDAMLTQEQRFKNGLAKGAPAATVYSKVGWNEMANYHDVGILTLPGGREFVVAILSQGNGSSRPIADFTATLYPVLSR